MTFQTCPSSFKGSICLTNIPNPKLEAHQQDSPFFYTDKFLSIGWKKQFTKKALAAARDLKLYAQLQIFQCSRFWVNTRMQNVGKLRKPVQKAGGRPAIKLFFEQMNPLLSYSCNALCMLSL